jgi:hypothetical protein
MTSILRKFSRVLLVATIATTALVVDVAPAHAYTCGYNDASGYISHSEVALSFSFEEQCSDGRARVTGRVYDTICDSRAALAIFSIYRRASDASYMWRSTARAENGCGSSATFTFSGPSPSLSGWKLWINMAACSRLGNCSSNYNHYYYG